MFLTFLQTKPAEEFSSSSESESSFEVFESAGVSAGASLDSFQEKYSDLSDISEDEDAIKIDMMKDIR